MLHFIFPSGPKPTVPYPIFDDQVAAIKAAGYTVSAFPENVLDGLHDLPTIPTNKRVVYRGWMLDPVQYENLTVAILSRDSTPYVPAKEYELAHRLPNWYPFIKDLTAETRFFSENADFEKELEGIKGPFFVKDHVKSVKDESIAENASKINDVVAKIRQHRGRIDGGVSVRNVEKFLGDETRYFVLEGVPFAPSGRPIPDIVNTCAKRIRSRFFSIDVAKLDDGSDRIIEIGDGQVSDLVGWSPQAFVEIWKMASRDSENDE